MKSQPKKHENIQALLDRAAVSIKKKNYNLAISEIQEAIKVEPNSSTAYILGAVVYYELRDLDKAESFVQQALKLSPNSAEAYNLLGSIRIVNAQYHSARDSLLRALQLSPDSWKPQYNLAVLHFSTGEYSRAMKYYKNVLIRHPSIGILTQILICGFYAYPRIVRSALVILFLIPLIFRDWKSLIFTVLLMITIFFFAIDYFKAKEVRHGIRILIIGMLTLALHLYIVFF